MNVNCITFANYGKCKENEKCMYRHIKPCQYYIKSKDCPYGNDCKFWHLRLCANHVSVQGCNDPKCRFLHRKLCINYMKNKKCRHGSKCKFWHNKVCKHFANNRVCPNIKTCGFLHVNIGSKNLHQKLHYLSQENSRHLPQKKLELNQEQKIELDVTNHNTTYLSVIGTQVQTRANAPKELISEPMCTRLLESLECPISCELMKIPVVLPTGSIYEKNNIIAWFALKNTDPLTGIEIPTSSLQLIPILNYRLLLDCLEKTRNGLIFHSPYGHIYDLLSITAHSINQDVLIKKSPDTHGYVIKNNNELNSLLTTDKEILSTVLKDIDIPDNVISFDLRDYLRTDNKSIFDSIKRDTYKRAHQETEYNWRYLTIHDILNRCAITERALRNNTYITNDGMFIHSAFTSYERGATCSAYLSDLIRCAPIIQIKHNMILDIINAPLNVDQFTIISKYDSNLRDDYKLNNDMNCINIHNVLKPCKSLSLYEIFEPKMGENHQDWYLEVKNAHQILYDNYLKHLKTINPNSVNICNKMCNDIANNFVNKEGETLNNLRMSLGLPTYASLYSSDYSFLTIKTNYFNAYNANHIKMMYCVGTHFENVTFKNVEFMSCVFIACSGKLTFKNCDFDISNNLCTSFYNANADIRFDGDCKFTQKTLDTMPDRIREFLLKR